MRPAWLHDLRLAWRHPEIRRGVLAITFWKAAFWVTVAALFPIKLALIAVYAVGAGLAVVAEKLIDITVFDPVTWVHNRRTPYYAPIREKLRAKGVLKDEREKFR